ncbi:MAG: hypothetical protein RIS88_2091 [Pseudomonadota bacterium]|jgi:branched-subunit amino acid transport protein
MTDFWTMAVIAGLTAVTVITRGFFVLSNKPWRLPAWAERGLQYAPIAALTAVVVPEVVMTQGQLVSTWMDARIFGAVTGMAVFFWRRDSLLTIVAGMAVYLPLHLVAGW